MYTYIYVYIYVYICCHTNLSRHTSIQTHRRFLTSSSFFGGWGLRPKPLSTEGNAHSGRLIPQLLGGTGCPSRHLLRISSLPICSSLLKKDFVGPECLHNHQSIKAYVAPNTDFNTPDPRAHTHTNII